MATKEGRKTKSKLTLSVAPKYVAMLRRASARCGRSITELVEEYAEKLDKFSGPGSRGEEFLKRNLGVLDGKVKPEEWDRDDRIGDMLRKHVPRAPRSA
ncbi:MAG: hypothetical protein IPL81_07115 [Flavobacteriales bacterium]|jgi:hypothetical protein|nr:hypothetical protein [Flavobacteriales bacterium]MBK6894247.1 hypothetical protein [Flavobacteriales bacterium]MBK7248178.1 hypothetical protein [Flavobacteriales bacterium]MBK7287472.1 hypothetical protein [Flavobacteriales bacterium]MBK9059637.1 hypothetical protein [Flavobacteriales bacterium]